MVLPETVHPGLHLGVMPAHLFIFQRSIRTVLGGLQGIVYHIEAATYRRGDTTVHH